MAHGLGAAPGGSCSAIQSPSPTSRSVGNSRVNKRFMPHRPAPAYAGHVGIGNVTSFRHVWRRVLNPGFKVEGGPSTTTVSLLSFTNHLHGTNSSPHTVGLQLQSVPPRMPPPPGIDPGGPHRFRRDRYTSGVSVTRVMLPHTPHQ